MQAKVKQTLEELRNEEGFKNEFRAALENAEHFQNLRDSVTQITGMLVSKKSKELTAQQRHSLQIIFGDSSVMYSLKTRLAESEEYARTLTRYLAEILRLCISIKGKIVTCWRQIQLFATGFSQVSEEELHNMQL